MKKLRSKLLGGEYWLHPTKFEPKDGLPCFNHKEIELLKNLHRVLGEVPKEFIQGVYDAKKELGVELIKTQIDAVLLEKAEEVKQREAAKKEAERLEKIQRRKQQGKNAEIAHQHATSIIDMLKKKGDPVLERSSRNLTQPAIMNPTPKKAWVDRSKEITGEKD